MCKWLWLACFVRESRERVLGVLALLHREQRVGLRDDLPDGLHVVLRARRCLAEMHVNRGDARIGLQRAFDQRGIGHRSRRADIMDKSLTRFDQCHIKVTIKRLGKFEPGIAAADDRDICLQH